VLLPGFIMDIGALSWSGEQHYLRQSSNAFSEEVLQAFTTSNLGRYLSRIIDMKQEAVRVTAREDAICGVKSIPPIRQAPVLAPPTIPNPTLSGTSHH
jgi:hypothetical protein